MLWSLGDVTEPFHVNLFDVQKKNLYRLLFCGRDRDQIRYISAGAGGRGTESCGQERD